VSGQDWTKDENGEYVRWHRPPHYVNGILNLLLAGEGRLSHDELRKRRSEYLKLRRREMRLTADP